jgi:spermidine/putrescine transport system permease protein
MPMRLKDKKTGFLLRHTHLLHVAPVSVWVVLFVFAPLVIVVYYSFVSTEAFGTIIPTLTLKNYEYVFHSALGRILARSLIYAMLANMACLLMGYPMAYWIATQGGKFKAFFVFLVVVPSWTCYIIRVYAAKMVLEESGLLNNIFLRLDLISSPLEMLYTPGAVLLGLAYIWLPFMVLPIYAALDGLDPSVLEAAADLGATPLHRFFTVTLPLTKGGIFAGTILTSIPALGDWLVPYILGGNKKWMAGNYVQYYFVVRGDFSIGSSMAVALTATVILMIYLFTKLGGEEALERII